MTFEELEFIEKRLTIQLPNAYKEIQLHYPEELIDREFNHEYFTTNVQYLVQINEMFRTGGLPTEYLVIGNDIGGNHFFIELDDSDFLVYYLDHEEASLNEEDATWEELLDLNLELIAEGIDEFSQWLIRHWGRA